MHRLPRPKAPNSGTPAISVAKRTHRVQWITSHHSTDERYTYCPRRLFSEKREPSSPYPMAWSCNSLPITDWAIQRMVNKQNSITLSAFLIMVSVGANDHSLSRHRTRRYRFRSTFHFYKVHSQFPAITIGHDSKNEVFLHQQSRSLKNRSPSSTSTSISFTVNLSISGSFLFSCID